MSNREDKTNTRKRAGESKRIREEKKKKRLAEPKRETKASRKEEETLISNCISFTPRPVTSSKKHSVDLGSIFKVRE